MKQENNPRWWYTIALLNWPLERLLAIVYQRRGAKAGTIARFYSPADRLRLPMPKRGVFGKKNVF